MALKKSELYSSIWRSCDELRGGMDASQYKDYVLVLLFVKYVSDKYAGQKDALIEVPKGGGFKDMVALKGDKEIGDKINKIIAKLAEANDLKGVIDQTDFNAEEKLGKGKEMVDRLSNLVAIFDTPDLDFRSNRAEGDDLLGDAYEYLMRNFATESGKSKGQFYTPAEVSRIMAKVVGIGAAKSASQSIYDPTCGSGALLLKAHDEASTIAHLDLALYGQEKDQATSALAKMNMILHDCPTAEIWKDNTLSAPYFKEKNGRVKQFDFAVANPPFSDKAWTNGFSPFSDEYKRFEFGVPPKKNGDYAYMLHMLASLKSNGKGAIIMPHGVLFRGNAEADIRKSIVQRGYIKGIIGLPPNLFYGTGIPACIVVLDKENAPARKGIFMIDASKAFMKDGNKNRLRSQDVHRIVDVFNKQLEIPKYSRMVPTAEISDPKNDYNLNIPRYVDNTEPEDIQDIDGHLRGGIPDRDIDALQKYWDLLPKLRTQLFESAGRPGYCQLRVSLADLKTQIFEAPEFTAFTQSIIKLFEGWKQCTEPKLKSLSQKTQPKAFITEISEGLLGSFHQAKLVDPYDIYQRLMTYWDDTMQDDVYMVIGDGWKEAAKPKEIAEKKGGRKEIPDLILGKKKFKADLIPAALMIARYFGAEQEVIDALTAEIDGLQQQLDELRDEHGIEGGLLEEVVEREGDKLKITAKSIKARLKDIADDTDFDDERKLLHEYDALSNKQSQAKNCLKLREDEIQQKLAAKYNTLTEAEIKTLVIGDKWLAKLSASAQSELDGVSQSLTRRIRQLADRYAIPLPTITMTASDLSTRVVGHLKKMGSAWI